MSVMRLRLAFALSPLIPSILFLIWLHPTGKNILIMMLGFSIIFSYLPSLLLGIPFISFLRKHDKLYATNVVLFGAVLGIIVYYSFGLIFSIFLNSPVTFLPNFSELVSGALLGVLVALPLSVIAGIPFYRK